MTWFQEKVYNIVSKIPRGKVLTYKEVAVLAGSPRAARAVGSALRKNDNSNIPCHRVIKNNGDIGQYNGLAGKKIMLLRKEGFLK